MASSANNNIFYGSPLHILDYVEEQIGPYAVHPSQRIPGAATASYPVRRGGSEHGQKATPGNQAHQIPDLENTIPVPSIYGGGELPQFGLQYGMAAISLHEERSNDENSLRVERATLMHTAPENIYENLIRNGDANLRRAYAAGKKSSTNRNAGIESRCVNLRYLFLVYIANNYF